MIIGCGYCRFSWDPRRKICVGVLVINWEAIVIVIVVVVVVVECINGLSGSECQLRLYRRTNGNGGGHRRSHHQCQVSATFLVARILQEFIIGA